MKFILVITLVLAPFCLALGIVLPLVRFETLYLFDSSPSLIEIVVSLVGGDDFALAGIVFLVSILFPLIKMMAITAGALGMVSTDGITGRLLPHLSRWSLMDVLLVALVIVAAKTGGIAKALSQPGLWFYAASAILAVGAHVLSDRLEPQERPRSAGDRKNGRQDP